MWPKDFRTLFCEQHGCALEDFDERVFWRVLYPHALLVAPLIRWLMPNFFRLDFETIDRVGQTFDRQEFAQDLDRYQFLSQGLHSALRSLFLVRVSGRKLMRLRRRVDAWQREQAAATLDNALQPAR
jgi:hypothetical protein